MSFLGNVLDDIKLMISKKFYEHFQNDKFDDPHQILEFFENSFKQNIFMLIQIQIINQINHEYVKVNLDIHKQMIELP